MAIVLSGGKGGPAEMYKPRGGIILTNDHHYSMNTFYVPSTVLNSFISSFSLNHKPTLRRLSIVK